MYYIAKEGNEIISEDSTDKTCFITFDPRRDCPDEKIAICPKVVRIDGKQFKVSVLEFIDTSNNLKEVRVPEGVGVFFERSTKITRY